MKNFKIILITALVGIFSSAMASSDTLKIKTSAQCDACKRRIEHNMTFEKGVKSVSLDDESKVLTLTYDSKKTSPEKLKVAVTKIGYDADEMPADKKAYDKLPKCCKKGGMESPH